MIERIQATKSYTYCCFLSRSSAFALLLLSVHWSIGSAQGETVSVAQSSPAATVDAPATPDVALSEREFSRVARIREELLKGLTGN